MSGELLEPCRVVGSRVVLTNALDVASCNRGFVADSEHGSDLELELVKVAHPGVDVVGSVALVVLLNERFDPSESLSTHVTRDERNTFLFGHLFSLKHKEEVPLHEPIIEFGAVSVVEIGLVNIDVIGLDGIGHVDVGVVRAARGSTRS